MSLKPKFIEEIFHHKQIKANSDIIDISIDRVEPDSSHPEGIRYSLTYVQNDIAIVQFDNHLGHGHHKHINKKRLPYTFVDEWQLLEDFEAELNELGHTIG